MLSNTFTGNNFEIKIENLYEILKNDFSEIIYSKDEFIKLVKTETIPSFKEIEVFETNTEFKKRKYIFFTANIPVKTEIRNTIKKEIEIPNPFKTYKSVLEALLENEKIIFVLLERIVFTNYRILILSTRTSTNAEKLKQDVNIEDWSCLYYTYILETIALSKSKISRDEIEEGKFFLGYDDIFLKHPAILDKIYFREFFKLNKLLKSNNNSWFFGYGRIYKKFEYHYGLINTTLSTNTYSSTENENMLIEQNKEKLIDTLVWDKRLMNIAFELGDVSPI